MTADQATFLTHFAELGVVKHAAEKVGVTRQTVYNWRRHHEDFRTAYLDAEKQVIEGLEDKAFELAFKGSERMLLFLLETRCRCKYAKKVDIDLATLSDDELRSLAAMEA